MWWERSCSTLTFDRSVVAAALPLVRATAAEKCRCHLLFCAFQCSMRVNSIFSVWICSVRAKKGPIPNLYCPAFDRKHLTACGFTAASQIKYPSAFGLTGWLVRAPPLLQSLHFLCLKNHRQTPMLSVGLFIIMLAKLIQTGIVNNCCSRWFQNEHLFNCDTRASGITCLIISHLTEKHVYMRANY